MRQIAAIFDLILYSKILIFFANFQALMKFSGKDLTMVGWGTQLHILMEAAQIAKERFGANCEVIDLKTILPWDADTVAEVCSFPSICGLY